MSLIAAGFPPYEYREYPKFLKLPDGSEAIAEDAGHEAELLGADESEALDKSALIEEAKKRGLKIDKRWSAEKLRDALAAG